MIEIRLNEIAVAIGAPIKPRRIGLGPHTINRMIGLRLKLDVQEISYLPRSQFRRALIGAAKKTMCVGTANRPGS